MIKFILNRLMTLAGLLFLLSVITFWVNVRIYDIDLHGQLLPEYGKYMRNLLCLNLGTSDISGRPVMDLIRDTLPSTAGLLFSSLMISLIIGISCGSTAALTIDRTTSTVLTDISIFAASVPVFLIAVFLIIAVSLNITAIPSSDELSYFYEVPRITAIRLIDILLTDSGRKSEMLYNCLLHLVLPAATISVLPAAELTRITRNSLRNVMLTSFAKLGRYGVNQYLKNCIIIGGYRKDDLKDVSVAERIRDPFKTIVSCLIPTMPYASLEEMDHLYILEDDDNAVAVCENQNGVFRAPAAVRSPSVKDHYVVIGNGALIMIVLNRLNDFLPEGTPVTVITYPGSAPLPFRPEKNRSKRIQVQTVCASLEDYFSVSEVLPEDATSVLILADDPGEKEDAIADKENRLVEDVIDERTLSRLLFLRQIREDRNASFNITCEINLDRNRQLAEYTGTEDFIVGSRISALIITQISQTRSLHRLYAELLDPFGTEFYFRRAADYMELSAPEGISVYDALAACAAHNEVFIGFRLEDRKVPGRYKRPLINPPKWENKGGREILRRYSLHENDLFVVLAGDS